MSRLELKQYSILNFRDVLDIKLKVCLGIIGYLYVHLQNKYKTSFVPKRFIVPFNRICKYDIQNYLTTNDYIIRHYPNKKEKEFELSVVDKNGKIHTLNNKGYKMEAKLYFLTNKLRSLYEIILNDDYFTNVIDKNLHHLSGQYFNHYYHSYRNIKIDIPYDKIDEITPEQRMTLERWGDSKTKDYFKINEFGFDDNEWVGEHINVFNLIPRSFLNYTSLGDVVEVGLKYYREVLLADQLLKVFGKNDYSDFFNKTKYNKKIVNIRESKGKKATKKEILIKPLFQSKDDYNVYDKISYFEFWNAVYGFYHIDSFAKLFKKANNYLYDIKRGIFKNGVFFNGFTFNIKPLIFKNDIRLFIDGDHPAFKRGQLYYKVVPLVIAYRQVQLMHDFWMRLKKCGIMFIPLECSVAVEKKYEVATTYILKDILNKYIEKQLMCEIIHIDIKNLPQLELQVLGSFQSYVPDDNNKKRGYSAPLF